MPRRAPADHRGQHPGIGARGGRRHTESHSVRGALAGIAMAALAVAAHGIGGGGYPGSAGLTLLLLAAAAIGAVATVLRPPLLLPALMAAGQPLGHIALSGLAHDGHASGAMDLVNDGAMTAAHAVAAVAFAFLILVTERLYGLVSQAVRAVLTRPSAPVVPSGTGRWATVAMEVRELLAPGAHGPRAPPVAV